MRDGKDRRLVGSRRKIDSEAARQVGERIRRLRNEKLKWTQFTLASELGVSHGTVSYWERGGNATPANLRRLAEVTGVSMEWIQNGIDATAFHPRWGDLEQRLMHLPDRDLEEVFNLFDQLLDLRDKTIERAIRKGRKPPGSSN